MLKDLDIVTGLNDSFIKIAPVVRNIMDYIFMVFSYLFVNVNRFKIQQELNELFEINKFYYEKFDTSFEESSIQWPICISMRIIAKLFVFTSHAIIYMCSIQSE